MTSASRKLEVHGFIKNFRFDQEVVIEELLVENDIAVVRLSFDGYLHRRKTQLQRPSIN